MRAMLLNAKQYRERINSAGRQQLFHPKPRQASIGCEDADRDTTGAGHFTTEESCELEDGEGVNEDDENEDLTRVFE